MSLAVGIIISEYTSYIQSAAGNVASGLSAFLTEVQANAYTTQQAIERYADYAHNWAAENARTAMDLAERAATEGNPDAARSWNQIASEFVERADRYFSESAAAYASSTYANAVSEASRTWNWNQAGNVIDIAQWVEAASRGDWTG